MHSIAHLIAGVLVSIILGLSPFYATIFIIASVAIDLDHFLEWNKMFKIKKGDLLNPRRFKEKINYQSLQKSLHLFHTFEILTIIFLLSYFWQGFFIIGLAFSIHILMDAVGNIWNRNIFHRGKEGWLKYWFLTRYIIKGDLYTHQR